MRLFYSLLISASLLKLSLSWNCDARCPLVAYLECLEYEAKNGNRRQLFFPHDNDDASYLDEYEQEEPETLDMSVYTPTTHNNGLRGSQQTTTSSHRELADETYFQLKLYHELGYCWQSEWEDRLWCAECNSTDECYEDDYLEIQKCNATEAKQYFLYEAMPNGVGGRIKPLTNTSLCWERTRVNAHQLQPCDDIDGTVNKSQIFRDFDYHEKFELHPFKRGDNTSHPDGAMCLSNHHHPKKEEVIRAETCTSVRADNSSFWIVYNAFTGANTNTSNNVETNDLLIAAASDTTLVPTESPSTAASESWSAFPSTLAQVVDTSILSNAPTTVTSAVPSLSSWPSVSTTPSLPTTTTPQEPTVAPVDSTNASVQTQAGELPLQDWGWNGCTVFSKCPQCAGDCDVSDHVLDGHYCLVCLQCIFRPYLIHSHIYI